MSDTTESMIHNFPLRLPHDVYEAVKREAARDHRSVNAQIVWRLRQLCTDAEPRMEQEGQSA